MKANKLKIEALSEAVVHYSGYREPGSPLHIARNPGGLKAHTQRHARDEHGNRIFTSVLDGMQALIFDTHLKVTGESSAKLKPTDTLVGFAAAHNQPSTVASAYVKFLRKAMKDDSLSAKMPLSYFLED